MQLNEIPNLNDSELRQFGITTGAIVAALFGLLFPFLFDRPWPIWPWVVLAVLFAWALVAPATLDPFYKSWMKLGLLLGRVTTPVILTLVFLVAILPASILLRLARKDFMRRQ